MQQLRAASCQRRLVNICSKPLKWSGKGREEEGKSQQVVGSLINLGIHGEIQ